VGLLVGGTDGTDVGLLDGDSEADRDGLGDGRLVGLSVGGTDGTELGFGEIDGPDVGTLEGTRLGT